MATIGTIVVRVRWWVRPAFTLAAYVVAAIQRVSPRYGFLAYHHIVSWVEAHGHVLVRVRAR